MKVFSLLVLPLIWENGDKIDNSAIGFENGVITYVGNAKAVDKKKFKQVIDASGKHVVFLDSLPRIAHLVCKKLVR